MKTITDQELAAYLTELKRAVNGTDSATPDNVIFFNAISFYFYIKDLPCRGRQTIDEVLSLIEPYIPIRLTQEMFDMFLDNILTVKNGEEPTIEMMIHAKGDFLLDVREANTPEAWANIVDTCESIREMKESRAYSTLV
ncbi:MAG: hypothetical protein LBB94_11640 [Clostridiales bacterium]|nr:hypothetical protein [Clostridiales bacterium]